ncbi:YAP1 binding protein 2 [Scheffersomyces coipomensis]|uniref:YAP1 binding protein 2 n=1 Tax=Scheffersomyces coipomensis TaxID=1788519 RepID=UPI00315D8611
MSDSEVSETSESTIEPFQFEKVLESLDSGAKEAVESKDYLSYSTLLDIYLSEPTKYSYDEREQLLSHLLTILSANKELTYEIGWDLPNLLILYVESDFNFQNPIRTAPCVYKILKNFEALALNGNPKELFLKCCELLTTIKISDVTITDDTDIQDRFFDVKLYCIFELIDSCLKRIKTYYPSRFLAMTVASYINCAYNNATNSAGKNDFMMKRAYSFARNYINPPLPDEIDPSLTKEEIAKIKDDEEYLQRKLLTGFITSLIYFLSTNHHNGYSVDHFSFLQEPNRPQLKKYFEYEVDIPVMNRIVELALSYDIELSKVFRQYIDDADALFKTLKFDQNEDELSGEIFEKVVIDYQTNLLTSLINSDAKSINDSVLGCVLLYTHKIAVKRTFDRVSITFNDAVNLTLRTIIPQMVQSSFVATGLQDAVLFWGWYALYENNDIELQISSIPKTLLAIYFQTLFYIVITTNDSVNFRYVALTLLTKILALAPESASYTFLKDSLLNCPYERDKATLIGILKELLTKDKQQANDLESLSNNLAKATIKEEEPAEVEPEAETKVTETKKESSTSVPPPLPHRDIPEPTSTKYIKLDKEKLADLFSLINLSISEAFIKEKDIISIDPRKLSTLSAYLNLLVVIKNDITVITNKAQLDKILDTVEERFKSVKTKHEKDNSNVFELNAVGMLEITLDRIKA